MKDDELDFLPKDPGELYEWQTNFLAKIDDVAEKLGIDKNEFKEVKEDMEKSREAYLKMLEALDAEYMAELEFKKTQKLFENVWTRYILSQKHGRD